MNYFVDTNINELKVEELVLGHKNHDVLIIGDLKYLSNQENLWTMYFNATNSKDGLGVGVLLISPNGRTYKLSFTLAFTCTNNVAEYVAFLLGLRL